MNLAQVLEHQLELLLLVQLQGRLEPVQHQLAQLEQEALQALLELVLLVQL